MKMKLFFSADSPYSRKARVAIEELKLGEEVEEIAVDPFAPSPEFLTLNPLAKVPTLVTERGDTLPDSAAILEYLAHRKPGLAALPRGARRWEILRRHHFAEGVLDAATAIAVEKRRPESIQYMPWLDRKIASVQRTLDVLSSEAGQLALQTPGACEIACGVALAYLDFRLPYVEWRRNREPLAHWFTVFSQRPSMAKTGFAEPPGK
ncbi:MAG TPA: glutathione S-transferase N-terminal domain-containing protein [Candidatus Binatia bacterium]|nr:glutathione S-transferase N-terminal domain-containing protein [Candidatus Binatia bacterium]